MKLGFILDALKGKDPNLEVAFNAHDSWGNPANWSDLNTVSSAPPSLKMPGVIVFNVGRPWPRKTTNEQDYGYSGGESVSQDAPDGRSV